MRARVRELCFALPGVEEVTHNEHSTFTVGAKKKFAYFLVNHHGDGITGLNCRAPMGQQQALMEADPARYYYPSYIGRHGWIGMRLDVEPLDWERVAGHLEEAYLMTAPKPRKKPA